VTLKESRKISPT